MLAGILAAFALAVALAMDAFAVAAAQGARFRSQRREAIAIAATFGAFQGIMPLIGWVVGAVALTWVAAFDHWIAFGLLGFLGAQMIFKGGDEDNLKRLSGWALLVAGFATSVDALAAGIALPAMALEPLLTCAIVAVITLALSFAGLAIGKVAGDRHGRTAEVLGGVILIGLGLNILLDHTGMA